MGGNTNKTNALEKQPMRLDSHRLSGWFTIARSTRREGQRHHTTRPRWMRWKRRRAHAMETSTRTHAISRTNVLSSDYCTKKKKNDNNNNLGAPTNERPRHRIIAYRPDTRCGWREGFQSAPVPAPAPAGTWPCTTRTLCARRQGSPASPACPSRCCTGSHPR